MNKFEPKKVFTLLRVGNGSKLAIGSEDEKGVPLLGEYHPGSEYNITQDNFQGVAEAIAKGLIKQ